MTPCRISPEENTKDLVTINFIYCLSALVLVRTVDYSQSII